MKMWGIFHPRSDEWKDLMIGKTSIQFMEASQNKQDENISGMAILLLTKIPEQLDCL